MSVKFGCGLLTQWRVRSKLLWSRALATGTKMSLYLREASGSLTGYPL